jgi:hypothetical protein
MELLLWIVCVGGTNLICVSLISIAYFFPSLAKPIALALPAIVPLFLFYSIRSYWDPSFNYSKSLIFAVSMGNFLLYLFVWSRWIGRV